MTTSTPESTDDFDQVPLGSSDAFTLTAPGVKLDLASMLERRAEGSNTREQRHPR